MLLSLEILIVGNQHETVEALALRLSEQPMLTLTPYVAANDRLPDEALMPMPDAIVFCVDASWNRGVWELIERIPSPRPPLFIVTAEHDLDLLRTAMRVGVRDVFKHPVEVEEFAVAVSRIVREDRARRGAAGSRLISFMNTKGGSGASLIAANVALAMVLRAKGDPRLLLIDFDFQFGGLPTYLNLVVRDGFIKALEFVDSLDEVSLRAYVQRHPSGVHLLAAAMDEIIVPEDVTASRVEALLEAIDGVYDDILVDLPHRIDGTIATVLERSDIVALVTQQTIAHLHETKRLVFLLHKRLGIDTERLLLVVNRFDRRAEVGLKEFGEVFPTIALQTLPNDYLRASESVNLGVPVCENAAKSPLGIGLMDLAAVLDGSSQASGYQQDEEQAPQKTGLFGFLKGGSGGKGGKASKGAKASKGG
jgi:pilus assembly protein CpaE